jgi:tetratricopeptide (TPR) repeat protein
MEITNHATTNTKSVQEVDHPDHAKPDPPSSSAALESKALLDRAKDLLSQNKLQESQAAFTKVVGLSAEASEGFFGLGAIQFRREDYAGAAALFQSCLRLDPKNANAYYFLGESWEKQHLPEAAIAFFKEAIAIDPDHHRARQKLEALRPRPNMAAPVDPPIEERSAHKPVAPGSGFYECIRNDPSPLAQETWRRIHSLALTSVIPRLSASAGSIIASVVGGLLALFLAHVLLNGPLLPYPSAQNVGSIVPVVLVVLGICLLLNALMIVLRVKNTKYTLDKGRLHVAKGIFSKNQQNVELYRVKDIGLHQTFLNRMTGDGLLTLYVQSGHRKRDETVKLLGFAPVHQLREIFDQLRNLVALLRSGPWGKGIIY